MKIYRISNFLILLLGVFLVVRPETAKSQHDQDKEQVRLEHLISDVYLQKKGAKELLNYYKKRNTVRHPVDRSLKAVSKGNIATEKDFETADNAMKHIFVGQPAYPPYFCGEDIDWGTRPVPDNEWVWQLNRMSFWDALGRAY